MTPLFSYEALSTFNDPRLIPKAVVSLPVLQEIACHNEIIVIRYCITRFFTRVIYLLTPSISSTNITS